MRADIKVWIIF